MEFLGLGAGEWLALFALILLLFGPKDIEANTRKVAGFIRRLTRSGLWRDLQNTREEINRIPRDLMRDSGLDELTELQQQLRSQGRSVLPPEQNAGPFTPPGAIPPEEVRATPLPPQAPATPEEAEPAPHMPRTEE